MPASEPASPAICAPGFFALARMIARWQESAAPPLRGTRTIAALDASERNGTEARVLGWLTFAFWAAAIEAAPVLDGISWMVRVPLAIGAALVALQLVTMAVAVLLERTLVAQWSVPKHTVRAWHTRGHIVLLLGISVCVVVVDAGHPFLRVVAWSWIGLGVANAVAALVECGMHRHNGGRAPD